MSGFEQSHNPILHVMFKGPIELQFWLTISCWKALDVYFNIPKFEKKFSSEIVFRLTLKNDILKCEIYEFEYFSLHASSKDFNIEF